MLLGILMAAMLLATQPVTPRQVIAAPGKATCLVCKVMKGEAEEEPIKAKRSYEGKGYGFCSEKCARAFEADPAAYVPPTFPRRAPSFALKDLAGKPISTESLKGKVVLLDFWATWCVPCRKSLPRLQRRGRVHRRGRPGQGEEVRHGERDYVLGGGGFG